MHPDALKMKILMYLRRNHKTRMEVSIDEPLNVDWDGNELLLSDILGTDEDVIYRDMENEAERRILRNAVAKLSSGSAQSSACVLDWIRRTGRK